MHDYIIRGGTLIDGGGAAGSLGDVAIRDGVIVAAGGSIREAAKEVIDADGAIVTPAWVDIHTHYDGQVTWDSEMNPSASHGVGTIVMGNCGVGFAPVPPDGHADLIELMEGVEDIPGTALYEGMPWGAWETYPQYLDFLAGREFALNVSSMVAHGAVRNYVMGARGRANQAATEDDISRMAAIVEESLRAGAVGFSTSRINGHRSIHGDQVPGTYADEPELQAIAAAMRRAGAGVFQLIPAGTLGKGPPEAPEQASLESEVDLICRLSQASGRPSTFTLFENDDPGLWRNVIGQVKAANQNGAQVAPQVGSRPTGLVFTLRAYHPFMAKPSFRAAAELPHDRMLAELRKPEVKARILAEENTPNNYPGKMESLIVMAPLPMEQTYALTRTSSYEPTPAESFAAKAAKAGVDVRSYLYDYLVGGDGRDFAVVFFTNYGGYSLDPVREMQMDPTTVTGLSDGGAHVGLIFDAVAPTYQLTYWARDRSRGATIPLEHVIHRQTRRNAKLFGFLDRGVIAPGMRADLNVIDFERLHLQQLELRHDLPAGGARLMQGASGYLATLVNGQVTRRNDQDTGVRSGRLLRSGAGRVAAKSKEFAA